MRIYRTVRNWGRNRSETIADSRMFEESKAISKIRIGEKAGGALNNYLNKSKRFIM